MSDENNVQSRRVSAIWIRWLPCQRYKNKLSTLALSADQGRASSPFFLPDCVCVCMSPNPPSFCLLHGVGIATEYVTRRAHPNNSPHLHEKLSLRSGVNRESTEAPKYSNEAAGLHIPPTVIRKLVMGPLSVLGGADKRDSCNSCWAVGAVA